MSTEPTLAAVDVARDAARRLDEGQRWCLACRRWTDGTYVASGPCMGALCGPGCFRQCEEPVVTERRLGVDERLHRLSPFGPGSRR